MNAGKQVRTIAIWTVYIGLFLVTYQLTRSGRVPTWGVLLIGVVVLPVLFIAVFGIRNVREIRRFNSDNTEGIAMLARGEHQRARDLFWQWAERSHVPVVSAFARHNVGWSLVRQGKHAQAAEVLAHNDAQFHKSLKANGMHKMSAVDLAIAHALHGDLAAAEQALAKADERDAERHTPDYPAVRAFARALVACRGGRASDAVSILDERWAEYDATLPGATMRSMRVIRAFALAAAGPRNAGVVESALASSRPAYPDEYTFLGVAWPEMQQFLAAHDLTRA